MSFNLQPIGLKNNLIELIPLKENDFNALFEVASDPLLWEQHPNKLRYKKEVFQNFFEGAIQSKGSFLIKDIVSNEVIGSSRFYDFNKKEDYILIGYTFIARKYWGKGYNLALKTVMIDYVFKFVSKIYFHIGAFNFRSQKAIEKLGAIKIDEFEVEYYGEDSKLNFIYLIEKSNYAN
jgi:RimJ/RimL family protein N-acetyltransferase